MTMIRWSPTNDLLTLQRAMQSALEDNLVAREDVPAKTTRVPFDVIEREDELVLRAPVPGFRAEEIDVNFEDGVLTVTGEHADEEVVEEGTYRLREWTRGSFRRRMRLRTRIDVAAAKAEIRDGVLELRLPKAEETKPRKIEVSAS